MAQITSITSESLQAKIRELLPSQQGFGEDLQASNVIVPTLDLTPTAEGTTTPQYLQTALAFASQTAFSIFNTTTVIANTPGFYRLFGVSSIRATTNVETFFSLSDGLSTKLIWQHSLSGQGALIFDFTVFLRSGDSISGQTNSTASYLVGSVRQVADVNGTLVQPVGFTPQ